MISSRKVKASVIIVLVLILLILATIIFYSELGINKEVPKRAKYVGDFNMECEVWD